GWITSFLRKHERRKRPFRPCGVWELKLDMTEDVPGWLFSFERSKDLLTMNLENWIRESRRMQMRT
ncbi:hypothetical protein, partial [Halobacillus sp. A5]|uniref:hypothetical protein n=1 Tax=Halobacillus sp. A5 TaxID=2880263 RepID=UPI0020A6B5F7